MNQRFDVAGPATADLVGASPCQPAMLTPRQTDVLRLLSRGFTVRAVARELGLGVGTVKTHLGAAYARLGTSNRIRAVMQVQSLLGEPVGVASSPWSSRRI